MCVNKIDINKIINSMTLEEKAAQLLCPDITQNHSDDEILEIVAKHQVGGIFLTYIPKERCKEITELISEKTKIPVIVNGDLVNGAGARIPGCTLFPWQMAAGAADSEDLAEKMGIATAKEGRDCGIHWTFSPVVDLSINLHNPMTNIRTFGGNPEQVSRLGKAYIRGIQKEGLMAATAKHFPGDGVDDRDPHICTTINSLSKNEWMILYGKLWQEIIDDGVMTIMPGHIALPWLEPAQDYRGPLPATLSKKIQIDLLRNKFNFKGAIVSDAICMAGYSTMIPSSKYASENIRTGSDMVLFSKPKRDLPHMINAVKNGKLSEERINNAVQYILELKIKLGLMDRKKYSVSEEEKLEFTKWADELGTKSISLVRNEFGTVPVKLQKGDKVLTVTCSFQEKVRGTVQELVVINNELEKRGFIVDHLHNPGEALINEKSKEYKAVFMNIHVPPRYGTIRMFGPLANNFWNSFWLDHPSVVFTSFGDPTKIYEMPYLPNYINAYSNSPASQKAAVKVWLGEEKALGKNPFTCSEYFQIEV